MVRTIISVVSLTFATIMFFWPQLQVQRLKERNLELVGRVSFFSESCSKAIKKNQSLQKEKTQLSARINAIERNRPGRKKYLIELNYIIKQRNIKYGIGGN